MGRWQTDAFRAATGAQIAFQNPGGLRRDWLPGPLTLRDLWETNPFRLKISFLMLRYQFAKTECLGRKNCWI